MLVRIIGKPLLNGRQTFESTLFSSSSFVRVKPRNDVPTERIYNAIYDGVIPNINNTGSRASANIVTKYHFSVIRSSPILTLTRKAVSNVKIHENSNERKEKLLAVAL